MMQQVRRVPHYGLTGKLVCIVLTDHEVEERPSMMWYVCAFTKRWERRITIVPFHEELGY